MTSLLTWALRGVALSVPIALGALSIGYSDLLAQAPAPNERQRPPTPVRVLKLTQTQVVPRVTGHGSVAPARDWRAVARIDGEVVETATNLADGTIMAQGSMLMRIDDTDLRLSLAQIDAQRRALVIRDDTLNASLEIAQSDLDLSTAERSRQAELATQGVATQTTLDQARRAELAARAKLTEIRNQLTLNAAEREVLDAQRAIAARSLDFTTLRAPFDLRIASVSAELGQVVSRGQVLLTGEGTEAVEIAAQFPMGRLGPLVRSLGAGATVLDLAAQVRLPAPGHDATWDAQVMRVSDAIDARTQSTGIVVRVDNPLDQAQAGRRPPLRRNTFVEVELSAPPRMALIAPADALRGGQAYVVADDGTLERREISVAYAIGPVAVIADGLAEGDRLVVSDPVIAMPGMAVKPMPDKALKARITAIAAGTGTGE